MKSFKEEEKEVLHNFLDRTFFNSWRKENREDNFGNLELQVTPACDKRCSYCYYKNFGEHLYPHKIRKKSEILSNLDSILDWINENEFNPRKIELFSGDIFSHRLGIEALDKVIDKLKNKDQKRAIIIPTNGSFVKENQKRREVEERLEYAKINNIHLGLSISVDGKYCDPLNRPHKGNENFYTDEYYESLFEFAKKWNFCFHPMIYFDKIERWIENFIWFQNMFKKHDIPYNSIYLLEVRNKGWTVEKVREYKKFFWFINQWLLHELCKGDKEEFVDIIVDSKRNMNIFSFLGKVGRGLGCSIQSSISIRLGDLTVNPCHRLSYPQLNYMKFVKDENNKIKDIEPINSHMMFSVMSLDKKNLPFCQDCIIKDFCGGQCLGNSYETMKDPFIPEPSVCRLFHAKLETFIQFLQENKVYEYYIRKRNDKDVETFQNVTKYINKIKE